MLYAITVLHSPPASCAQRQRARVIDIFRKFDVDRSGEVTRGEFQNGIYQLGLGHAPRTPGLPRPRIALSDDEISRYFDSLDADGSGAIDFQELHRRLGRAYNAKKEVRRSRWPHLSTRKHRMVATTRTCRIPLPG